jgi:hypothetical protein
MELAWGLKLDPSGRIAVIGWRSHYAVGHFLSFVVFRSSWWA